MGRFSILAGALCAAVLFATCAEGPEPGEPFDNVVLVTIDTLRADHLGCYGYPRPTTPFLDSLAARGVRFERAVAPISITAPSHASLFTSQYPARHRLLSNGMWLGEGVPDLAATLSQAGFETQAVVGIRFLKAAAIGFESVTHKGTRGPWKATNIVNRALAWLDQRESTLRFFLWVHFYDVHETREDDDPPPSEELRWMQRDAEARGAELTEMLARKQGINLQAVPGGMELIDRYDAQLAYVDRELRRLHDRLSAGLPDQETLWVVTADHGEGLGSHDVLGHGGHLFDEQLRVPLIFWGGDRWLEGRVVSEMARLVDLFPTIAGLLDVPIDAAALELEGESLIPLLGQGDSSNEQRVAFAQRRPADEKMISRGLIDEIVLAATEGRYKYILHSEGDDQLYDLETDPLELHNLIGQGLPEEGRLSGWLSRRYQWMLENPLTGAVENPEIDEEHVEELRALGYLN